MQKLKQELIEKNFMQKLKHDLNVETFHQPAKV